MPEMMRTRPHLAFKVDNIEAALAGHEILVETFSPGEGVRVAFINHDGAVSLKYLGDTIGKGSGPNHDALLAGQSAEGHLRTSCAPDRRIGGN